MDSIENFAQNHPEMVVNDLMNISHTLGPEYIKEGLVRKILKFRGINKWLRNRRLIIQLKEKWKKDITKTQEEYLWHKKNNFSKGRHITLAALRTKMNVLMDCRQQVRAICHSARDVDFPLSTSNFGELSVLPKDFPNRPNKKYFK